MELENYIPPIFVTSALSLLSTVWGWMETSNRILKRLSNAFDTLFSPRYFIFFEGTHTPHMFHITNPRASGSAAPNLMYNADTHLFFPWSLGYTFEELQQLKHRTTGVLSIELVDKDTNLVHYDLTDFVESVRYVEADDAGEPSIWHIISAWTISSGIVPCQERLLARYVDSSGETHTVPLFEPICLKGEDSADATEDEEAPEATTTPTPVGA
jgi:hypothetical protein